MTLVQIWKENPERLQDKRVDQIIGFAGDGKLGDNNSAPQEFRDFLARVSGELICNYANDCLENSFKDSGLALQDIVNEVATRLGFKVEAGRYRGTKGDIGHDGIWTAHNGHSIVAEVKTTDAYRLPIETVARYRTRLIESGRINEQRSSILIIVGREDTGELEAQIRGSRYAWDVRLISIDALLRLMKIRQDLDSPNVEEQIRSILLPREYTRVDSIIDLIFSTTEDIFDDSSEDLGGASINDVDNNVEAKKKDKPVSFNVACVERISRKLNVVLNKKSRVVFGDLDSGLTITCAVSKEYKSASGLDFWFAFHKHQLEKLSEAPFAYACFGCGSADRIAVIPFDFFKSQLDGMNQTIREDGAIFWHVAIHFESDRWIMHRRKGFSWPDITSTMLLGGSEN